MATALENNAHIKLFKNVELRVEKNDNPTTLVDIFFEKINDFLCFHELCGLTKIQVRIYMGLPNQNDNATPNVVDESNAAGNVAAETQTTPIAMSPPTNQPSTAKRRNTEMDSSDLETNTRKSMRSNVRSIVQSVKVHSDGAFQNLNVAECLGNRDCSIPESSSVQSGEDARDTSDSDKQNEKAETPQRTNETIPIALALNTPVTSVQSSDHQVLNEIIESHHDDADELNEVRETASNDHAPMDQTSSLSNNSRAIINRRRSMDFNSTKQKTLHPKLRFTINSFAKDSNRAIANHKGLDSGATNDTSETYAPPTHRVEEKRGEQSETGSSNECADGALDHWPAQVESETTVDEICADELLRSNLLRDTSVLRTSAIGVVSHAKIGKANGLISSKPRKNKFPEKHKRKVESKAVGNDGVYHVKCKSRGCKELFESINGMVYHVATYHVKGIKRKFSCHLCKKIFQSKSKLQRHMNAMHIGLRRFKCPFAKCSKAFTEKGNLHKHTNAIHTKKIAFECTKCPAKFYNKQHLTRHLANAHGQGITYSCYLCKKSLGDKQTLLRHMDAVHMGLRSFKCLYSKCSMTFAAKDNLQKHINAIHTKKISFKCTKCPAKFYYKQHLTRHLANEHGQGITYSCYLCKKTFRDKFDLQRHMNVMHIGLRSFKCPFQKCSKAFAEKGNLQKQTNAIHTKQISFKCTKCPAKFYHKQLLTRHLANEHGQGITYSCYLCKKSLGNKKSLQLHMNLFHTGQSLCRCPVCFRGFQTEHNVKQHMNGQLFACTGKNHKSIWSRRSMNVNAVGSA